MSLGLSLIVILLSLIGVALSLGYVVFGLAAINRQMRDIKSQFERIANALSDEKGNGSCTQRRGVGS